MDGIDRATVNYDDELAVIRRGVADAVWEQIALNRDVSFFMAVEAGVQAAVTEYLERHGLST